MVEIAVVVGLIVLTFTPEILEMIKQYRDGGK